MAQYSALRCVSGIWQNSEKPLISNGLRFIVTNLPTAALWVLFHQRRHTYASLITLSQGVPLDTVRELMGHRDWRATQIYAHLTNDKVSEDMGRLQERIGNKFELTDNERAEVVISTPQIKRTKRMRP